MGKSLSFGLWKGVGQVLSILTHRSPLGRVLGGVVVALILWIAAWVVSYQVLSEGVLREPIWRDTQGRRYAILRRSG